MNLDDPHSIAVLAIGTLLSGTTWMFRTLSDLTTRLSRIEAKLELERPPTTKTTTATLCIIGLGWTLMFLPTSSIIAFARDHL